MDLRRHICVATHKHYNIYVRKSFKSVEKWGKKYCVFFTNSSLRFFIFYARQEDTEFYYNIVRYNVDQVFSLLKNVMLYLDLGCVYKFYIKQGDKSLASTNQLIFSVKCDY
uniref:Uncharacterized protein n=1 Tax=Cacopsylla melanoneura TaxID=428564 RepID=A0A8D8Y6A1_9HEMI